LTVVLGYSQIYRTIKVLNIFILDWL
jgi:hypothetical protein